MQVGDEALAIGDPLGVTFHGTLTNGIISGINRDVTLNGYSMTLIQTTAALNSGNSGGPLMNLYGQVIGINNMKMVSASTTVEGLGFAVPSSTVKEISEKLATDGGISRPVLGVSCYGLDEKAAKRTGLKAGLVVAKVNAKSDCAAQGIQVDDVITAIDGKHFETVQAFKDYIADFPIGKTLTLTVSPSPKTPIKMTRKPPETPPPGTAVPGGAGSDPGGVQRDRQRDGEAGGSAEPVLTQTKTPCSVRAGRFLRIEENPVKFMAEKT